MKLLITLVLFMVSNASKVDVVTNKVINDNRNVDGTFDDYVVTTESDSEDETPKNTSFYQRGINFIKTVVNSLHYLYKIFQIPEEKVTQEPKIIKKMKKKKRPLIKLRLINRLRNKKNNKNNDREKKEKFVESKTSDSESTLSDISSTNDEESSADPSTTTTPPTTSPPIFTTEKLDRTCPYESLFTPENSSSPSIPSSDELNEFWTTGMAVLAVSGLLLIFGMIALLIVKIKNNNNNNEDLEDD